MKEANDRQIAEFKMNYCQSEKSRKELWKFFDVKVDSHEELLPERSVSSYAKGTRKITGSFFIFRVTDSDNGVVYYPVFSETVGREVLHAGNVTDIPPLLTIFSAINGGARGSGTRSEGTTCKGMGNVELRSLIILARSLMLLHQEPRSMDGVFKEIYDKLEKNPFWAVKEPEIKAVNTAIKNYLRNNKRNIEGFKSLGDYLEYVTTTVNSRKLKKFDFEVLRRMMYSSYPNEELCF